MRNNFVVVVLFILVTTFAAVSLASEPTLDLVADIHPTNQIAPAWIEAMQVLDKTPEVIVFITRNEGAECGGGTPASAWKLTVGSQPDYKASLSMIQETRGVIFQGSDGALFTGGGWCMLKPPYFSQDSGESWEPADKGIHPYNSTFSYAELNGKVYAGTGYNPQPGEVYRWLGASGENNWEKVFVIPYQPRNIVTSMTVYQEKLFVAASLYEGEPGGVPVYMSIDGNTFESTNGIPGSSSVSHLSVVNDKLIAFAGNAIYTWNSLISKWERSSDFPILSTGRPKPVVYGRAVYVYGKTTSDQLPGIYVSLDEGKTWQKFITVSGPEFSTMTIHGGYLYIGTNADGNKLAHIYRLNLNAGK